MWTCVDLPPVRVDERLALLLSGLTKLVVFGTGVLLQLQHKLRHVVWAAPGQLRAEGDVSEPLLGGVNDGLLAEAAGLAFDMHKAVDVAP